MNSKEQFLDQYEKTSEKWGNTRYLYGLHLRQAEEFLKKPVEEATSDDMLALSKFYSDKYSGSTARNKMNTLSSYFSFLIRSGKRQDNPTVAVRKRKVDPNLTVKWLTDSEIDALLETAKDRPRDLAMVWLALHGLRVGEIVGLKVDQYMNGILWNVRGKSLSRNVPLVGDAQTAMETWIGKRKHGPMFPSPMNRNDGIRRITAQRLIYRLTQQNGRRLNIHALRHTYGSRAIRRGVNSLALAQLMGHQSTATTQKYVHLNTETLRSANEMVYPSSESFRVIPGGVEEAAER